MEYLFTKTPLAFFVQNLWRDEAFTFLLSEQSIGNILRNTAADFNPPLYYIFMHYWMLIFGSSEIAMRSVSLLFYVLTLFIMFEIMVLVFKISFKRALVYFMLIIANPVLLTYAFEARMYMMGAFFVTLSYFALWTGRKKLYIFAVVLALHTHYFTILILLAQIVAKLPVCKFKIVSQRRVQDCTLQRLIRLWWKNLLKLEIIPIIFFLPWILFFVSFHDFSSSEFWVIRQPIGDIIYLPFVLFTGYQRVFGEYFHNGAGYTPFHSGINFLLWISIVAPIVFALYKSCYAIRRHPELVSGSLKMLKRVQHDGVLRKVSYKSIQHWKLEIALWAFLPPIILYIVSLFATPMYHPRYFMFSAVGFLLYLILIIDSFLQKYAKQNTLLILTVILLLFVTGKYNTLNLKYNAKRTISPLFQEIDRSMREGDKVYLTSELDYFLAKYYMKNDAIFIFGIPYEEIHEYVGKVLIPPGSSISSGIPTYPARAFFVYYDRYVVRSEM